MDFTSHEIERKVSVFNKYFLKTNESQTVADMTNMEYEQCIKLNLTPLQMSIRRHAAEWIKVMGEKLNDSGKEIMFALRDRLGAFSNLPLAGALFRS